MKCTARSAKSVGQVFGVPAPCFLGGWNMVKKSIVLLVFFLMGAACQQKGLDLQIHFDHVNGLKQGDRVIFEQNRIGRVVDVRYREKGSFVVGVQIEMAFAKAVTEHARFFIVVDPRDKTHKAVEMALVATGGTPLGDGAAVQGSSRFSALFDRTWQAFENGLGDLEKQFKEFSDQLRDIPETKAYKDLRKELERLSEEMKRAGEATHEKIEKELLPRLKRELEALRERLFELQKDPEADGPLEV